MTSPLAIFRAEGDKQYQYVDTYEIQDKQIDPVSANYNPLGATPTEGCANCQWFIGPGRCVVVSGDISPTGLSDLWMAKTVAQPTPILVQIVGADSSATKESATEPSASPDRRGGLIEGLKGLLDKFTGSALTGVPAGPEGNAAFSLFRQKDNRLRFLTAWSNNFTDREGEVFPEYAHKEYIEWADRNQQYPELWLWHTKGTKYGQVDWLDYTDGFVYASGLIDAGYEDLADAMVKEDCGVSHGFHGLQRGKEVIFYRPFEISTLPRTNAAVWTTSFNIIGEGATNMAFTQQKKDWLKEHGLDDAAITAAETQATQLSKSLKELGVSYKDTDLVEEAPPPPAPVVATAPVEGERAASAPAGVSAADLLSAINKQNEILATLAGSVKSIDDRVKAVEATDDQKIAATLAARPPVPTGVAASKDTTNIVDTQQTDKDKNFFGDTFLAHITGQGG